MTIGFYGAAQQVTGSKHLVQVENGSCFLLECGMFQGRSKEVKRHNKDFGFEARSIDFVVLSHAHIDHSGLLPKLVKEGFDGPIYCTSATKDLCHILLHDSAHIQAEDARHVNKWRKREGKELVEPLYSSDDVDATLRLLRVVPYGRIMALSDDVQVKLTDAGHILGSACVHLTIREGNRTKRLLFTGDIGRYGNRILRDPQPVDQADILIAESTYGNRLHQSYDNARAKLKRIIDQTCVENKGRLIIPAFSVGRTQEIVYILNDLYNHGELPRVPIYVDSPMAVSATEIMRNHPECFNQEVFELMERDPDPFGFNGLTYVRKSRDSQALNDKKEPFIVLSASGMIEGGRIKHHVIHAIEDARNTILIVGFCSHSSVGGQLMNGARRVRIFGREFPVNCAVERINSFSAHGDYLEMARLLRPLDKHVLKRTFLVHGNPEPMAEYKAHLEREEGFHNVSIPAWGEEVEV